MCGNLARHCSVSGRRIAAAGLCDVKKVGMAEIYFKQGH